MREPEVEGRYKIPAWESYMVVLETVPLKRMPGEEYMVMQHVDAVL